MFSKIDKSDKYECLPGIWNTWFTNRTKQNSEILNICDIQNVTWSHQVSLWVYSKPSFAVLESCRTKTWIFAWSDHFPKSCNKMVVWQPGASHPKARSLKVWWLYALWKKRLEVFNLPCDLAWSSEKMSRI